MTMRDPDSGAAEAQGVPADDATGPARPVNNPLRALELKAHVAEALSLVFDPEIPVNIYELGLVYDIVIDADADVWIRMTLTSPACPAAQQIPIDVQNRVRAIDGVRDVHVDIVWDPPWTPDRMSDVARLQLGML